MSLSNKFTEKQQEVLHTYLNTEFKMMVLSGAVRSGKTYIDNYLFLMDLQRVKALADKLKDKRPQYILAGFSSNTIFNNVISSIGTQFGIILKPDVHHHYHLFGVDIVPSYTGTVRGVDGIRGMTAYGAYVNEASLANEGVFQEIKQRCSKPNAHIICDTNPDNPQHWLKQKYIDNDDPETMSIYFHFTIDDNPTLDPSYVSTLKASTPTGMYYDRAIKGLWVSGEGAVYRDFDERKSLVNANQLPEGLKYYAGVDWGYSHDGSIAIMGEDNQGNVYLVESHTKKYEEIDYWVKQAKKYKKKYGNITFYADSARVEHVERFKREGLHTVLGRKSVLDGIEMVGRYIKANHFFVNKSDVKGSQTFLYEVYNYVWNPVKDEPVKQHDHLLDAIRYAIYTRHYKLNEDSGNVTQQVQFLNQLGI
ncbi:PBSX family phage terminase large subunit [Pediococcus stilesii]|uniref:PBSX family phage terminase large subunit n=1 Tax=Pediococcus stilesii TaxID=331679 RepID=A0A5R9BZ97_9LACO|nr:PBSX family phage terminase large subunit [Pediococcus stilesii]TLQ05470.1 PBSX family phage terminase large subunit [Pediococcus stilesii]